MKEKLGKWTDTDRALTVRLYNAIHDEISGNSGPEAAIACCMAMIDCYEPDSSVDTLIKFVTAIWENRPGRTAHV